MIAMPISGYDALSLAQGWIGGSDRFGALIQELNARSGGERLLAAYELTERQQQTVLGWAAQARPLRLYALGLTAAWFGLPALTALAALFVMFSQSTFWVQLGRALMLILLAAVTTLFFVGGGGGERASRCDHRCLFGTKCAGLSRVGGDCGGCAAGAPCGSAKRDGFANAVHHGGSRSAWCCGSVGGRGALCATTFNGGAWAAHDERAKRHACSSNTPNDAHVAFSLSEHPSSSRERCSSASATASAIGAARVSDVWRGCNRQRALLSVVRRAFELNRDTIHTQLITRAKPIARLRPQCFIGQ